MTSFCDLQMYLCTVIEKTMKSLIKYFIFPNTCLFWLISTSDNLYNSSYRNSPKRHDVLKTVTLSRERVLLCVERDIRRQAAVMEIIGAVMNVEM